MGVCLNMLVVKEFHRLVVAFFVVVVFMFLILAPLTDAHLVVGGVVHFIRLLK